MNLTPRLIYRALAWKERKRVELARRRDPAPGKQDHRQDNRQDKRKTGERGETLAYWYLRQAGYTIVARNLRAQGNQGEVDLIGWGRQRAGLYRGKDPHDTRCWRAGGGRHRREATTAGPCGPGNTCGDTAS